MERLYQSAERWLQTLISILKILVQSSWRFRRLPLANADKCFLVMNGPSLNKILNDAPSRDFLKRQTLWCANHFAASALYGEFRPAHYIFMDPLFWEYSEEDFFRLEELGVEASHPEVKKAFQRCGETLRAIREQTDWPLVLYVPYRAKNAPYFQRIAGTNPNVSVAYYNTTKLEGIEVVCRSLFRQGLGSPSLANVLAAAIFNGINAGFRTLYLLGADHNWVQNVHVGDDNLLYLRDEHYYDDRAKQTARPVAAVVGGKIVYTGMLSIFESHYRLFRTYQRLQAYAEWQGCKIYNLSDPSLIDTFPRQSFREVMNA
ncbi:hypothetical protein SAMN05421823_10217 [Catalinimonas alkaloidigena]|uniref:DUF115 domain-containing protein n=1 Tax=Catalinimonas alkaloidigena TaxID=1075417 RepID=A0A1G8ZKN2_9BACT|nr:hypothetical protein [Catalinimonas alkaloidigena]SDK15617.1 hypothetical protein SAMN05421823_10217 [Catalinimonas alkaloidigena]